MKPNTKKQNPGKRRKNLKQRYYFLLNPYTDAAFTKCPKCETKTRVRKYYLLIHIKPYRLVSLNINCKYCPYCDLIIAKKHEIDLLLYEICKKNFPEILGNEYLIFGTLDRKDRNKFQGVVTCPGESLKKAYQFKDVWNFKFVNYESYPAREKIKTEEKNKKLLTSDEIYKKYENIDDAMEEIEKEIYRRVNLFAKWLHNKNFSEEETGIYVMNILSSQLIITVHEPPYMFLEDAKDDIPKDKGEVYAGESYGFLFKYHVFLDAIKETQVDENYIKALKLYFDFLLENKFIEKIPDVANEVFGKEKIYLRRLKEHHESDPEGEEWMDWFDKWCEEVFEI